MAYNPYMQAGNYGPYYMNQNPMQNQPMAQSYVTAAPQSSNMGMIWVDGEVGAKAFQMPSGWPANQPIALWDTNDTVIYLKSINQMGMPNPLQKIHYTMEQQQSQSYLPAAATVNAAPEQNYVTKEDFEHQMKEIKEMLKNQQSGRNQNTGNNGQQNRGGST